MLLLFVRCVEFDYLVLLVIGVVLNIWVFVLFGNRWLF